MDITRCYICGREGKPKKWENFFDFCELCSKEMLEYFERQIRLSKPTLRLESKN